METNTQAFNLNLNQLVLAILNRPADEKYMRAIADLRDCDKNIFTAQDVDISGSTLKGLCKYGILKVVGRNEVKIRISYGYDKIVSYNIYEKNTILSYDDILTYIYNERVSYYKTKIKQAEREREAEQDYLNRFQLKAKILGIKED